MRSALIVLAGGHGSRMGSLVEHTPKPLLEVAGQPMLTHLLHRLAQSVVCQEIFLMIPPDPRHYQAFAAWAKNYETHHNVPIHLLQDQQRGVGQGFFAALTTVLETTPEDTTHMMLSVADVIAYDYAPLKACPKDIVLGVVNHRLDTKKRTPICVDARGTIWFPHESLDADTHELVGVYWLSRQAAQSFVDMFAERMHREVSLAHTTSSTPEGGMTWAWPNLRDAYGYSIGIADLGTIVEANTPEALVHMDAHVREWLQQEKSPHHAAG